MQHCEVRVTSIPRLQRIKNGPQEKGSWRPQPVSDNVRDNGHQSSINELIVTGTCVPCRLTASYQNVPELKR